MSKFSEWIKRSVVAVADLGNPSRDVARAAWNAALEAAKEACEEAKYHTEGRYDFDVGCSGCIRAVEALKEPE